MTDSNSECNHEGMPRDREGPPPARRCLCSACDLALFRDWRKRVKALRGKTTGKAGDRRAQIMSEIRDSIGIRHHAGIGVALCEVQHQLYLGDEDDAAVDALDSLIEDEEMLLAGLPADDRVCPLARAGRAAGPLFPEAAPVDPLLALLRALVPQRMADDLHDHGRDDPAFVAEQLTTYLTADEDAKADMLAFHESGGVSMVEKAVEKVHDAQNPSAEELERWAEGDAPEEASRG